MPRPGESHVNLAHLSGEGLGAVIFHHMERHTRIGHEAELYMCILRINKRLKAFWLVGPALAHVTEPPQGKPAGVLPS